MSIDLTGTEYAYGDDPPGYTGGDFTIVLWFRLPATSSDFRHITRWCRAGGGTNEAVGMYKLNDKYRIDTSNGSGTQSSSNLSDDTWYGGYITYTAETGGGGNGATACKLLTTIAGDWIAGFSTSNSSLSDQSATGDETYNLGCDLANGTNPWAIEYAMYKIFTSVLSEADIKTELQYRNPQQTAWASHAFKSGALATDDSGNARSLTLVNTPAYLADEPSDILGDDPASGKGPLINGGLINNGLINSGLT